MRELKFRVMYKKHSGTWVKNEYILSGLIEMDGDGFLDDNDIVEQFTGLKDKNGKEIYENCELDGRYRVEYIAPKFVGKDIIKGDIIELYDNKFTITKEHCEISQNSERGIN